MEIRYCVPQMQVPGVQAQGETLHRMFEKVNPGNPQAVRKESPPEGERVTYIYKPKGRALEYSPLALNIYTGCDHGCTYCYNRFRFPIDDPRLRNIDMTALRNELIREEYDEQILLSFVGDPYCHAEMTQEATREVLITLLNYDMKVAILTKGGCRALRDIQLFKQHWTQIKVGATLSFLSDDVAVKYEPFGAPPSERIAMLKALHQNNIKTFVSVEPVIDTDEALCAIIKAIPWVDEFRIGKLNHDKEREALIDWVDFLERIVTILEPHTEDKIIYIKKDLREAAPNVPLPDGWHDMTRGWL